MRKKYLRNDCLSALGINNLVAQTMKSISCNGSQTQPKVVTWINTKEEQNFSLLTTSAKRMRHVRSQLFICTEFIYNMTSGTLLGKSFTFRKK